MLTPLLLISHEKEDLEFSNRLATANGYKLISAITRDEVRRVVVTHPEILVIWNAQNSSAYESAGEILTKYVKTERIFAVTDRGLSEYPHLLNYPLFGHHLLRRYDDFGFELVANLLRAVLQPTHVGLQSFFTGPESPKAIPITQTSQKSAVIEAITNTLTKNGIPGRIATTATQAVDELLLNAFFDAPVDAVEKRIRHRLSRDTSFDLSDGEQVRVRFAVSKHSIGVSVEDGFGSLHRKSVYRSLSRHLLGHLKQTSSTHLDEGFGLHGIISAGLSLHVFAIRKKRTEACVLIPRTEDVKTFRKSFRGMSLIEVDG